MGRFYQKPRFYLKHKYLSELLTDAKDDGRVFPNGKLPSEDDLWNHFVKKRKELMDIKNVRFVPKGVAILKYGFGIRPFVDHYRECDSKEQKTLDRQLQSHLSKEYYEKVRL